MFDSAFELGGIRLHRANAIMQGTILLILAAIRNGIGRGRGGRRCEAKKLRWIRPINETWSSVYNVERDSPSF